VDPTVSYSPGAGVTEPHVPEPAASATAGDQLVVGDIPAQRPGLQPRPALLRQLNRESQGPQATVLTGTCGTGKSQLAAAYARARLAGGWRLVAWINARDGETLLAGLAAVADAAGLPEGGSRRGTPDAGPAVRSWLEADGSRCLLVFDDAEDPALLRPFVPATGAARILITAAREPVAELGTSVLVDVFSAQEALAFLAGRTGLADEFGAAVVAAELGHLPLALDQAAAVIAGQHLEYETYLAKLRAQSAEDSLERQPYPPGAAEAVLVSLEAARAADPLGICTAVMELTAMLSPTEVRRDLLLAAGDAGTLLGGGRRVAASMVDQALDRLDKRSLLGSTLDGQSVSAHCLVAQVIRGELARRGRLTMACRAAASALHQVVELGDSMPQAIAFGQPLIADLERILGPDHPDTLSARNSLATACHAAGRIADAIPLVQQTLDAQERLLGTDHPSTLASRNNLASAYRATGRPAEAIPLFEQNVAACERLLGADHPKTLASRRSLDRALQESAQARIAGRIPQQRA
jgi:tetratricopeptide (TPR) repeat protein